MKKILLVICLLLLVGCTNNIRLGSKTIEYEPSNKNSVNLYLRLSDRNIYFDSLKTVKVDDIDLYQYFTGTYQTMDDALKSLTDHMKLVYTYKDGGSKLYEKKGFRILVCNTILNNKDIFVGTKSLEYESNYCKNFDIKDAKNMLSKVEYIEIHERDNDEGEEVGKSLKRLDKSTSDKIVSILNESKEYTGAINLPYAGYKLVFFDNDNNVIGEFIYCSSYTFFKVDYHEMYVSYFDKKSFNELVKLD